MLTIILIFGQIGTGPMDLFFTFIIFFVFAIAELNDVSQKTVSLKLFHQFFCCICFFTLFL